MIKYFDNAATTKLDEEGLKEMLPYLTENYANPSSIYSVGKQAKEAITIARMKIADAIGANVNEIYFTSCGSESDNLALKGIMYANKEKGKHIITSKVEHPAIMNTCATLKNKGLNYKGVFIGKKDKELIKRILGHSDLKITDGYIHNNSIDDLIDFIE